MSRSTALSALKRCGIPKKGRDRTHPGQLSFGYDYQDYRSVKNQAEQGVIRLMRQGRGAGLSLRQIVDQLNESLVPARAAEAGRPAPCAWSWPGPERHLPMSYLLL